MFDYAAGRTEPKISTVAGISRATGVSISWLAVGTSGELEKSPKVLTEGASLEIVRKFAWNIAATFWKEMPRRTKPEYVADQFVETLDFLLRRDEMNEDAASEVIHFGAERLKRRSER
ncbi:transcriptional regulator with XRE-family HTH domain [Labrenzia sp. EL_195]|nr:transcriptional regulator with XRE-family HTH domain [Labrenzia sp. EL_195]